MRHEIRQLLGVNLLTPPPKDTHDKTREFAKSKFIIDFEAEVAGCPGGFSTGQYKTVNHSDHNLPAYRYKWSKQTCGACPLKAECLGQGLSSKSLLLHPFEQELRNHREAWKKPEVRKEYRRRGEFERLINTAVRHGARQARSWGLTAANIQAHGIATTSNLRLLAKALVAANALGGIDE